MRNFEEDAAIKLLANYVENRTSQHLSKLLMQDSDTSLDTVILYTTIYQIGVGTDNSNHKRWENGVAHQQIWWMRFTQLRRTQFKAEQIEPRFFHRVAQSYSHRVPSSRFQRQPAHNWNFKPSPVMQFSTVAASTCLVRRSASISLVGFLPSETSPSVTICLHPEEHRVDVFHSSEASSAPNRNSGCGVHPLTSSECSSPRYRNHQTITLRFAGAQRNHACPLQYVQTVLSPASVHNQKHSSWFGCNQHGPCHTKIQCHLNQTNLARTPRKRANLISPISSRFDGCCILRAVSRHSICHWRDTVHAWCSHDTDRTLLCRSEPPSPSISSDL